MAQARKLELERLLRALSDRTRLRLVNLLAGQEVCVCHLSECLGISQPKVSRHLAYLRKAGVVTARREGKWMHYRVASPKEATLAQLLRGVQQAFAADREFLRDKERLVRTSCVQPGIAPLPQRQNRSQGAEAS